MYFLQYLRKSWLDIRTTLRVDPCPKTLTLRPVTIVPNFTEGNIKWEETFDTTVQPGDWIVIDNDGSGAAYSFEQQITFKEKGFLN